MLSCSIQVSCRVVDCKICSWILCREKTDWPKSLTKPGLGSKYVKRILQYQVNPNYIIVDYLSNFCKKNLFELVFLIEYSRIIASKLVKDFNLVKWMCWTHQRLCNNIIIYFTQIIGKI